MRNSRKLGIALLFAGILHAQQKAPYVGAAVCGDCHPVQFQRQSSSAHARALSPAAQHPLAPFFVRDGEIVRPPRFHFQLRRDGGRILLRASDPQDSFELPLEWAFGAGEQAVTFVSRLDADWYLEHYLSYYTYAGKLAPTPGHIGLRSNTLDLAAGLRYRTSDPVSGIVKCFECHSTGPAAVSDSDGVHPAELGVRCEACHGPGSVHVAEASHGRTAAAGPAIQNPKRMSAAQLNQFCGHCHRAPEGGPSVNYYKAFSVRYQPIYLSQSACFQKSQGALSCLTCHDPHGPLQHDQARYDRKCAGCHASVAHRPGSLPTAAASCTGCHMPQVAAQEFLKFTNHWIGVYRDGNSLMPRRADVNPRRRGTDLLQLAGDIVPGVKAPARGNFVYHRVLQKEGSKPGE